MGASQFHFEDILTDKGVADEFRVLPLASRTFFAFRLAALVVGALVIVQLVRVGLFARAEYVAQSRDNVRNTGILPARRGRIVDRFGAVLAGNEKVFRVVLLPRELPRDEAARRRVIDLVSELFDLDADELVRTVARRTRYFDDRVVVASAIDQDEFVSLLQYGLPGVRVEEGFRRVHDVPFAFSHTLGFTGFADEEDLVLRPTLAFSDMIGKTGIEAYYDAHLRGQHGAEVYFRDSRGAITDSRVTTLASHGSHVSTYIDKEFQEYFYSRMMTALDGLERYVGVGIAMNPSNGEVLALFSIPSYDTSRVAEYLSGEHLPLFNRAIGGQYSPGSTIKPLVAVAAQAEGVMTPEDIVFSAGYIEIPNPYFPDQPSIFKDWKAHGWVDMRSALARSSNVYFYEVGGGFGARVGLGIVRLKKWWQLFGLGEVTGIDVSGEARGLLPDPDWKESRVGDIWRVGDTYNASIGQGDLLVSPIGLLNYITSIANGGLLYTPRIMKTVYDDAGAVVAASRPTVLRDMRREMSDFLVPVQEGMRDAVIQEYGTARLLRDIPMPVWGKTGSAQVAGNRKTNAFFVGYGAAPYGADDPLAEADDNGAKPEIAILVIVEDAKEGSLNVVPVARDVFEWYYEHRIKVKS